MCYTNSNECVYSFVERQKYMNPVLEKELAPGVRLRGFADTRFKTMRISVHMIVPLQAETAAVYALLPAVMSRVCRAYPDYTLMSRYLCDLYGASLTTGVRRMGDCQVLSLNASSIADRYALDGQAISRQLAELLASILFEPYFEASGTFPQDSILKEKRQLLEILASEYNDKQLYARRRCETALFAGEPAGIGRCGSPEEIEKIDGEALLKAWKTLLETAVFEIFVLGDCDPEKIASLFAQPFSTVRRPCHLATSVSPVRPQVQHIEETLSVEQSKLVMGLRLAQPMEQFDAMRLMIALFGGTPSSKLFINVREKQSLCYYCAARGDLLKGVLFVESGIDAAQCSAVEEAVMQQLKAVQNGDFTDDEWQKAKLALANSCRTVNDYLGATENWYLSQILFDTIRTPEADIEALMAVTPEQIVQAAQSAALDTVYVLKGREGQ